MINFYHSFFLISRRECLLNICFTELLSVICLFWKTSPMPVNLFLTHTLQLLVFISMIWEMGFNDRAGNKTWTNFVHNRPQISRRPRRPWPPVPCLLAVVPRENRTFSRPKRPCPFSPMAAVPFLRSKFMFWYTTIRLCAHKIKHLHVHSILIHAHRARSVECSSHGI